MEELGSNFVQKEDENNQVQYESAVFKKQQRLHQTAGKLSQPRMFSMGQIRELFFNLLHTSQFRDDFLLQQFAFEEYKIGLHVQIEQMMETINEQKEAISELQRFQQIDRSELNQHVKEIYRIFENDHDQISYLKNRDAKVQNELEDIKGFQEVVEGKFEKNNFRVN